MFYKPSHYLRRYNTLQECNVVDQSKTCMVFHSIHLPKRVEFESEHLFGAVSSHCLLDRRSTQTTEPRRSPTKLKLTTTNKTIFYTCTTILLVGLLLFDCT